MRLKYDRLISPNAGMVIRFLTSFIKLIQMEKSRINRNMNVLENNYRKSHKNMTNERY